jgi:hypothetical protein
MGYQRQMLNHISKDRLKPIFQNPLIESFEKLASRWIPPPAMGNKVKIPKLCRYFVFPSEYFLSEETLVA